METNKKKEILEKAVILMKKYNKSKKPEKFIDGITNHEKNTLLAVLFYKKEFPANWKSKFMENLR